MVVIYVAAQNSEKKIDQLTSECALERALEECNQLFQ